MPSPPPRPHPHDALIAAAGLLGGLLLWSLGLHTQEYGPLGAAWSLPPLLLIALLELVRRTRPRAAVLGGTAAVVFDQVTPGNLGTILMFTDLLYAGVLYGSPGQARRMPLVTGLITMAVTVGSLIWLRDPQALLIGVLTGLVCWAPTTTGALLRGHREAADAARLRAEQTALLAEMDRAQAVSAERARMARELHDMVANHLSAIAIHATAALSLDKPATTRQALSVIRENSVEGLADMRRLIGLLRDSGEAGEAPTAAPTLDGLGALAEQARAGGLDVRVADGRPSGPAAKLPAPVDLAAYRIVQESLTNALKHASPGTVTVSLRQRPGALVVRVTSPLGRRDGPRAPGAGAGLIGMRERVELLDGTFTAGPERATADEAEEADQAGEGEEGGGGAEEAGEGGGDGKVWRVCAELPTDTAGRGGPRRTGAS
ncbi:sensor histidine kinase [Streptomyces sp. NPDC050560]|uniref:sensor histidine kinase n=1 Tax=Streptomyces sp. NPDC050560 TaxID=3365630 RepID=UPI00378E356E